MSFNLATPGLKMLIHTSFKYCWGFRRSTYHSARCPATNTTCHQAILFQRVVASHGIYDTSSSFQAPYRHHCTDLCQLNNNGDHWKKVCRWCALQRQISSESRAHEQQQGFSLSAAFLGNSAQVPSVSTAPKYLDAKETFSAMIKFSSENYCYYQSMPLTSITHSGGRR